MTKKWLIGTLTSILLIICGSLYVGLCDTDKEIKAGKADKAIVEANKKSIEETFARMEKAQALDNAERKADRKEQRQFNQQIQMLILEIVKEKK